MHKHAPSGEQQRACVFALHTPRQNQLLAALPPEDCERLPPHLQSVVLLACSIVHGAGEPATCVHFVTAGIATKCHLLESGETAEFAVVGNEGMVGIGYLQDSAQL